MACANARRSSNRRCARPAWRALTMVAATSPAARTPATANADPMTARGLRAAGTRPSRVGRGPVSPCDRPPGRRQAARPRRSVGRAPWPRPSTSTVSRSPRSFRAWCGASPGIRLAALRLGGQDGLHHLVDAIGVQRVGPAAGQDDVGERAQRVHVGRRRDGLALELLRARVGRCGRPMARDGARRTELAGNPEIQQLDRPIGGDEDVLRLDVAVDDEVAMRVRDAGADLLEECDAFAHREPAVGAVPIDGQSIDVLHHEVEQLVGSRAGIQQPRDVGVLEPARAVPARAGTGLAAAGTPRTGASPPRAWQTCRRCARPDRRHPCRRCRAVAADGTHRRRALPVPVRPTGWEGRAGTRLDVRALRAARPPRRRRRRRGAAGRPGTRSRSTCGQSSACSKRSVILAHVTGVIGSAPPRCWRSGRFRSEPPPFT